MEAIVSVMLLAVAAGATVYITRASTAMVQIRRDAQALRKQVKPLIRDLARIEAQADRIMEKSYRLQKSVEAAHQRNREPE